MKVSRDFKGIWIPKEIWLDKNLTIQEKVFLAEIDSLEGENGCFASNSYFMEFFGLSRDRIIKIIGSLVEKGYITKELIYKEDSKEVDAMRKLGLEHEDSAFFLDLAQTRSDEVVANMVIVLIYQADALLNGYINRKYNDFLREGGFREKLTRERIRNRG